MIRGLLLSAAALAATPALAGTIAVTGATVALGDGGAVVAAPVMYLCLTYDHRIVDGETAVKFLKTVKANLEEPNQMITNKKD